MRYEIPERQTRRAFRNRVRRSEWT